MYGSTSVSMLTGLFVLFAAGIAPAQDAPPPPAKKIQYSPYPRQTFPNRVYFGDTH
jgi:hypothetical protein